MEKMTRWIWVWVFAVFALGVLIQSCIFLVWDVSWLLDVTRRFLSDGTYVNNFFENNPPMIIYLYCLPQWIATKFGVSHIVVFRIWVFTLAWISLGFCAFLMRQYFDNEDKHECCYYAVILFVLAFVFFILPSYEFGQREHVTLLLVMPYFFTLVARFRQRYLNESILLIVGLMAGFGFAIKPYFLAALILPELYYWITHRRWLAWLRIETLMIALVMIFYLISIYTITPTYMRDVFPFVRWLYLAASFDSWAELVINPFVLGCLVAIAFFFVLYRHSRHRPLLTVMWLATIGFMISYFVQRKLWYYHIYPAFALATLLLAIYVMQLLFQSEQTERNRFIFLAVITLTLIFSPLMVVMKFTVIFMKDYLSPRSPMNRLINITRENAKGKYIYFFSDTVVPAATVADYSGAKSASRFPRMWLLPGILYYEHQPQITKAQDVQLRLAKRYMLSAVVDDFKRHHPELVFVDVSKHKIHMGPYSFNYLQFFTQSKAFQSIWSHYQLMAMYQEYAIYKLASPY